MEALQENSDDGDLKDLSFNITTNFVLFTQDELSDLTRKPDLSKEISENLASRLNKKKTFLLRHQSNILSNQGRKLTSIFTQADYAILLSQRSYASFNYGC